MHIYFLRARKLYIYLRKMFLERMFDRTSTLLKFIQKEKYIQVNLFCMKKDKKTNGFKKICLKINIVLSRFLFMRILLRFKNP